MKSNQILNITIICLILFLVSCAEQSKNQYDNNAVETTETPSDISEEIMLELEVKSEASVSYLSDEQKEAFQLRAIQKFQDFTDYLKIISDPEVDNNLKEHSIQLALELFVNDSILLTDSVITGKVEDIELRDYLKKIKSSKKSIYISAQSILFSEPLTLDTLGNYRGKINVSLKVNGGKLNKNINVCLIKIEKYFGKNEESIKEVRLGNIY